MSFTDRDFDRVGGAGRFRHVLRRIFGDSENPLGWSLPIARIAGITVKVHLLFIVYAVAQILWSIPKSNMNWQWTSISMGCLFGLVLLHEFGHCIACRLVGGEADEIILWPLGGLALCLPPKRWRADLITTLGGPLVNLAIVPITAGALAVTGYSHRILFNPFLPTESMAFPSYWMVALWFAHYINVLLLLFNVLVPMFPMDGARILQAGLWARSGLRRATESTIIVGFLTAGVLTVLALVSNQTLLFALAVFGGLMCWRERQTLRAEADLVGVPIGFESDHKGSRDDDPAEARRELKRRRREAAEQAEVDQILAKIAADGMGSLTGKEKRALQRATKRKRGG